MPNHVTNILTAPKDVLDFLATDKCAVDFRRVLPQPPELFQDGLPSNADGMAEFVCGKRSLRPAESDILGQMQLSNVLRDLEAGGVLKMSDEVFEAFVAILRSFRACGFGSWHDWNIEHWGTKWGAYDCNRESDACVRFDTAWSAPHPVIAALAERFPDAAIDHQWADEDIGHNLGHRIYVDGTVSEVPTGDPVAYACGIKGYDHAEYLAEISEGES